MTRAQVVRKLGALFVYLVWTEWVWGQPVAYHPTEIAWLTLKVIAGKPYQLGASEPR